MNSIFKIPEREYGPAPWWAWLGAMTPAAIDRKLKHFLAMEVYEIIIIPLYGLEAEYLGPEYFDLFRHTCRRCREWGLKLWIYDEFNWPSGTCAGRVLRDFPAARQRVIQVNRNEPPGGGPARPTWSIADYEGLDLPAYGAEWVKPTKGYLDTLNPEAVRTYINLTHEAFRREVGDYFGDVILGFFTDEPVVCRSTGLPYTPGLFQQFRKKYGYDLRPLVPQLAVNGPAALRVRRDYWGLVIDLFQRHFFRQYADWCAAHGLKMTGHLLFEETLIGNLSRNGDMFAMLSEMQVPGIDMLGCLTSFDSPADNLYANRDITGKLIESSAYFAQRDRTLCEAFGCMPNSTTLQKFKRAADYLFHHNLSMINDNLFPDTLNSFRKFCGGHAFWTPWTRHYNRFSRHIRTMSYLNAGSQLVTAVGLYYPGTDARVRYAPPRATMPKCQYYSEAAWDATQQAIFQLAHGLIRQHWDYYLVFDQVLRMARPAPGGLRVRDFNCRALVFPDIHYIAADVAPALRGFVKAGGVMICAGRIPAVLDRAGRAQPGRWGDARRVLQIPGGTDEMVPEVVKALQARLKPPLALSGAGASEVMATRRRTRAGEILFLTNFGAQAADIRIDVPGAWRRMDTVDGTLGAPVAAQECLRPNESLVCLRAAARGAPAAGRQRRLAALRDEWAFSLPDGNTVSLPMMIYKGRGAARPPADCRTGSWTAPCLEQAPMALKPEQTYWLRREIEVNYRPRRLNLVVDDCDGCEVYVNRRRVPAVAGRVALWDDGNLCCDLCPVIRRGRNEILVRYTPARIRRFVARMVPLIDLPPFVLHGDFLAASRLDLPEVIPVFTALPGKITTGSLHQRGYPHFTGIAEYRQTVRLNAIPKRVLLDLGRQNDLFEVLVNGRRAGVLGWQPYSLEVGGLLRRGANRISLRLHTALGGILSRYYKGIETAKPPVGLLETPVLHALTK